MTVDYVNQPMKGRAEFMSNLGNNSTKCACGKWKKSSEPICGICAMSDEEKAIARAKGGTLSRRISLIDVDEFEGNQTIEDINDFFNLLIKDTLQQPSSIKRNNALANIAGKQKEIIELKYYIELSERLRVLEAKEIEGAWQVNDSENYTND